jgi:hypothetical protein
MRNILLICVFFSWVNLSGQSAYPPRLDRAHSFFGVHFDFHADTTCKEIGKNVDAAMVDYVIDQIKPDFLQIDCKGHPGYSSYPTKVGNPAPGFVRDPLKIWREATARRGVALYMHYSGVFDGRAVELHPSWAVVNAQGKRSESYTSVFGPYADSLMIPQFKELSAVYGVDGIWVDGDCWAHQVDYSPMVKKLFTQKTGITQIPLKPGDPYWNEYLNFTRQGFRDYLAHYVSELHKFNPKFQIASNWAYSSFMPEPVNVPVDFISGDFSATNSLNSARFEGRFIRNQGKPWDLMDWGFSWIWNQDGTMSPKSVVQIESELAAVLSLGGGVQIYMRQQRDASVYKWTIPILAEAAKFVRARQPWCQHAQAVPQIGLILASEVLYNRTNKPFSVNDAHLVPMQGILKNLLSSQQVVDVMAEFQLANIDQYPLLIYPEWDSITPALKKRLLDYVDRGGKLLLAGPKSAALFSEVLNVTFKGNPELKSNGLEFNDQLAEVYSVSQGVIPGPGVRSVGKYCIGWDKEGPTEPAATITKYGKGEIGAFYLNSGEIYSGRTVTVLRDYSNSLIRELFPDPTVEVKGSHYVDVTLNRVGSKLIVNLVNACGPHDNDNVLVYDEIPGIGPLDISIRYPSKPMKVMLQPENKALKFKYEQGKISCTVDKLKIHDMIVVEQTEK